MIPVALTEKLDRYPARAYPNPSPAEPEGVAPLLWTSAKLFRAGTLDGAVFISNRFWCKAPAKRVSLAPGHVVAVARLDGTGPSTRDLLNTLAAIIGKEPGFRSLGDAWADTTIAHGPTACYQAALRVRGAARSSEITRVVLSQSSALSQSGMVTSSR